MHYRQLRYSFACTSSSSGNFGVELEVFHIADREIDKCGNYWAEEGATIQIKTLSGLRRTP